MAIVNKNKLLLKISCLSGVKYEDLVCSIQVKLRDGLMIINKNYSSVIEEVSEGQLKILDPLFKVIKTFSISNGWLMVSNNKCELFVSYCKEK